MKTSLLFGLAAVCWLMTGGCGIQTSHPNQMNAFDGASYDSLTLAHGALTSMRAQILAAYPRYNPVFDEADAAYAAAYNAYAVYRAQTGSQTELTVALGNLTVSIVALEDTFETDMHASSEAVRAIRERARTLRQRAAGGNVTVSDILTELEIAAAVARAIPGASEYAALASMVIDATSQALAAEISAAGQPIDLTTVQPIPAL